MPRSQVVRLLQRHEEREVIEPVRLQLAETGEGLALGQGCSGPEPGMSAVEQGGFVLDDRTVVHALVGEAWCVRQVGRRQVTKLDEAIQANQHRVAGECAEALVWRVGVPGWRERQNLPVALARRGQEVDKRICCWAQIPDTVASRERRRMEQDTATAGEVCHRFCSEQKAQRSWLCHSAPPAAGVAVNTCATVIAPICPILARSGRGCKAVLCTVQDIPSTM